MHVQPNRLSKNTSIKLIVPIDPQFIFKLQHSKLTNCATCDSVNDGPLEYLCVSFFLDSNNTVR